MARAKVYEHKSPTRRVGAARGGVHSGIWLGAELPRKPRHCMMARSCPDLLWRLRSNNLRGLCSPFHTFGNLFSAQVWNWWRGCPAVFICLGRFPKSSLVNFRLKSLAFASHCPSSACKRLADVGRGEIVGLESLASYYRQVDLDLVQPTDVDRAMHEGGVGTQAARAADRREPALRAAAVNKPVHPAGAAVRVPPHNLLDEAVKRRDAGLAFAANVYETSY